jgi:hypothetical protein
VADDAIAFQQKEDTMNAKALFSALAAAGLLLCGGDMAIAQDAPPDGAALQEGQAEDLVPQLLGPEDLRLTSVNGVDVWRLTCTTTPFGFVQSVRARVQDGGGIDGRRIYLHITRQLTGRTEKTTAPDGGISGFVGFATGGAGAVHFIQVSKDRTGASLLGVQIPEPDTQQAECITGAIVRPHTLVLTLPDE